MDLLDKYCTVAGVARGSRVHLLVHCSQWIREHPGFSALAVAGIGAFVAALVHHCTGGKLDRKPSGDATPMLEPPRSSGGAWGTALDALGPLGVPAGDILATGPPPAAPAPIPTQAPATMGGLPRWVPAMTAGLATSLVVGSVGRGLERAGEAHRLQLDSKFLREFEALREAVTSEDGGVQLEQIIAALEQCASHNVQYQEWLESCGDLECPICLQVLGPAEELARSQDPDCGSYHLFHRQCLPNKVRRKGCPVCCRPMLRIEPGSLPSPFVVAEAQHQPGRGVPSACLG